MRSRSIVFFFFSSRRRHTRLQGDWSSDVCSSDLATWSVSREKALESGAPAPVIDRIDATMAAIAAARTNVSERLTHILGIQDRVVKEIARCDDVLSKIAQAGNALVGPLFSRDGLPIWSPEARTLIASDPGQRVKDSVGDMVELTRDFLTGQLARVPFQIACPQAPSP